MLSNTLKILLSIFSNIAILSIVMLNLQFTLAGDTASEIKNEFILQFVEDIKIFYMYFNIFVKSYDKINPLEIDRFKQTMQEMEIQKKKDEKSRNKRNIDLYKQTRLNTIIINVVSICIASFAYFSKTLSLNEIFATYSLSFLFLLTEVLFFFLVIKPWIYTTKFNLINKIFSDLKIQSSDDGMCDLQNNITSTNNIKIPTIYNEIINMYDYIK